MARILIIDDDAAFRTTLQATLRSLGHTVVAAGNGPDGLARLSEGGIDMAFVDFRMPGMDGIAVLRARLDDAQARQVPLVMLTAHVSSGNTIEAMTLGAFDHLVKPVGRADIVEVVERALLSRADAQAAATDSSPAPVEDEDALVGHSPAMRTVHKRIGLAAASDLPVLITGETGTGKELAARALHRASPRANAPFVAVNCAAIPLDLMESELFGHRKGAFSGASSDRRGLIREADGGTLFLDEIGDMPLPMQAKLLRFLQEGEVTPLGGGPQKVDVRVLAATHRDLAACVADGRFRSDLRYRLNVVPIELPPLRERGQDILLLAQHFLSADAARAQSLSPAAQERLLAHRWPGNVRELRNVMQRSQVLVRGASIDAADLDEALGEAGELPPQEPSVVTGTLPEAVARLETQMIRSALEHSQGNRAEAARRLGIHRQLLYRKLEEYGL